MVGWIVLAAYLLGAALVFFLILFDNPYTVGGFAARVVFWPAWVVEKWRHRYDLRG